MCWLLHVKMFSRLVLHHPLGMKMKNRSLRVALKLFPCFFCTELGLVMLSLAKSRYACTNIAQFLCFLVNLKQRDVYRAGTSIHRGLAERLTHGEGDIGGADAGGCLDGQSLFLLGDFHCRAGRRCHCNLPQEHVDT